MLLKIKYGGSGDVKTQTLERAQKTILQCRTSGMPVSIDSNMIMSMINELLAKREKASEFALDSGTSLDLEDSKFDENLPIVLKTKPVKKAPKSRVKARSRDYWLDDGKRRRNASIGLVLIIVLVVVSLSYAL